MGGHQCIFPGGAPRFEGASILSGIIPPGGGGEASSPHFCEHLTPSLVGGGAPISRWRVHPFRAPHALWGGVLILIALFTLVFFFWGGGPAPNLDVLTPLQGECFTFLGGGLLAHFVKGGWGGVDFAPPSPPFQP